MSTLRFLIAAAVVVVCWIWTTYVRRMNMDEAVAAKVGDDWTAFIFFTFITTVIAGAGGWGTFHTVRQLLVWPKATAKILRYSISGEGVYVHPVFRFTTTDGRQITTISSFSSWAAGCRRPAVKSRCAIVPPIPVG